MKYFQKKYSFKIEFYSDEKLIIPEYKIELINKSKKVINQIENIDKIVENKTLPFASKKIKKDTKKSKKDNKKSKIKKKLRTLWVRKKKKKIKSNP